VANKEAQQVVRAWRGRHRQGFGHVIYIATNLLNRKQYVGQTKNFDERLYAYRCNGKYTYFEKALHKHGIDNFNFIKIPYPSDELDFWEKFWIDKLNTLVPNGYNLENGGEFHYEVHQITRDNMSQSAKKRPPVSLETRLKIRERMLGNKYPLGNKMSNAAKKKIGDFSRGKKRSPAICKKISLGLTGRKASSETKAKLSKIHRNISNETRKRMCAAAKKRWENHVYDQRNDPRLARSA
jgi:group I intron endonuclease